MVELGWTVSTLVDPYRICSHKSFSVEKVRDPASARRPPALKPIKVLAFSIRDYTHKEKVFTSATYAK